MSYPKTVTIGALKKVVRNAEEEARWCDSAPSIEPEDVRSEPNAKRAQGHVPAVSPHTKKH